MTNSNQPLTGHCLCSAVSITVEQVKPQIEICHCDMCRRWGGLALADIHGDSFVIEGEDNVGVYRSSEWAERAFCKTCGTNLWYRFLPTDLHGFQAGLFELPEHMTIKKQIFVDEKPHWYDFAQETEMQTGPEVIAEAKAAGFEF